MTKSPVLSPSLEVDSTPTTPSRKYRCGVIGLGRIGYEWEDSHANVYKNHPKTELVALFDTVLGKVSKEDWGILVFPENRHLEIIKELKLDIISVCTPPETHCKIVCDIAPYVKGIYCEKPIATTLEDADIMITTCQTYGTVLQINHQRRWNTPVFTFSRGVLNAGSHAFDTINYYFKEDKKVKFKYIDTDEDIFKLDFPYYPHVPVEAVEHLIDCIENKHESISSGEEAKDAVFGCFEMRRLTPTIIKVGKRGYLKAVISMEEDERKYLNDISK